VTQSLESLCRLFFYLQYLDGEIIVEEEFFVDNVGQVATQVRQLQVISQLTKYCSYPQSTHMLVNVTGTVLPGPELAGPPFQQKYTAIWQNTPLIHIFLKNPLLFRYFKSYFS
jgi:hypothetical protein